METYFDVNNNPTTMVRMKQKKKKDHHTGSGLTDNRGDGAKIKGKGLTER